MMIPRRFFTTLAMMLIKSFTTSALAARTILITGATDGIGQHTAKKLAADGNILLLHGRRPNIGAELVEDLKTRGAKDAQYFNADLSDLEEVERLAQEIKGSVEHIDVLINNAGVFDPSPNKGVQGYDMTWAVNVMAPFLLTRRLLSLVRRSNDPCPRIITTSSISQSYSLPLVADLFEQNSQPKSAHAAYSDSKLGGRMFTVQLAKILGKNDKIKCLTMDPGTVNTKMLVSSEMMNRVDMIRSKSAKRISPRG